LIIRTSPYVEAAWIGYRTAEARKPDPASWTGQAGLRNRAATARCVLSTMLPHPAIKNTASSQG